MSVVDRIRRVLGQRSANEETIPGAVYSGDDWGVIPHADPQSVFEGLPRLMSGIDPRGVPTPTPPASPPPVASVAPAASLPPAALGEDEWVRVIREAKARGEVLASCPTPPHPIPACAVDQHAAAVRTTPDQDWSDLINLAKSNAAAEAAAGANAEDWSALIRLAKSRY